jgi:hypothetical protein
MRRAALFLAFFSPAIVFCAVCFNGGNTLLFEDGLLQSFPLRVFLRSAFVNGFSPQWLPNSACGFSLLGEGQNGICFPITQIIYRTFSAETGWMIEKIIAQLVAFLLCYLFLRHLRVRLVGSLFGASVYTFCLFAFSATSVPAINWCYSLLPGIFLSCDHFIEGRPFSFAYLMMIIALVLLTGHPAMIIYIGMVISLFIVFRMVNAWPRAKTAWSIWLFLLALLGNALLAALIASPQLLPILQMFKFSARTVAAGIPLEDLQNTLYLHPIWMPLSLLPTPAYWSEWWFWSNHIRFPFYALFLGSIGVLGGAKGLSRSYFVFLLVFSFLMALGPCVGIWKFVHSLPVLRYLRYPFRWLFFLPLCVSVLSARGADYILNSPDEFPAVNLGRILKFILVGGLAAGIVLLIRYHSELLQYISRTFECSPRLTGLLWLCNLGMVIATFLSLTKNMMKRGVVLGIAFTIISLSASLAFEIRDPMTIRNLGMIGWKGDNLPNEPQQYRTSSALLPYDVWMEDAIYRHYEYTPNLTVLNGTLTTGHYFSFFPYWSANVSTWCQDALRGDHKKQIYLNLSSARWLFISDDSSYKRAAFPTESFKGIKACKNPVAMPRASVVFSYRLFSDEGGLVDFLESSRDFDPRRDLAILKQDAKAWDLQSYANEVKTATFTPTATIIAERPDRIEIELDPAAPTMAFLVLSDTYYPGWRALVDGVEKKVLRANYAFRGIQLPKGAKRVVFFFDPLVPDAALPLPTFFLATIGGVILLRYCLFAKRKTGNVT